MRGTRIATNTLCLLTAGDEFHSFCGEVKINIRSIIFSITGLFLGSSRAHVTQTSVIERIVEAKLQTEKERAKAKDEGLDQAAPDTSGPNGAVGTAGQGEAAVGNGGLAAKRKRCGNCVGCRAKSCDHCK